MVQRSYGDMYVAFRREDYELLSKLASFLGITKSSLIRLLVTNPIKLLSIITDYMDELTRCREEVGRLKELKRLEPLLKYLNSSTDSVYLVVVPSTWSRAFEAFTSLKHLDEYFRHFIEEWSLGALKPYNVNPGIRVIKVKG